MPCRESTEIQPRRGRKPMFVPRRLTNADAVSVSAIRELAKKKSETHLTVRRQFEEHCSLNNELQTEEDKLLTFIGSMRNQGLLWSTITTRVGLLNDSLRRGTDVMICRKDILAICSAEAAKISSRHAEDYALDDLVHICNHIECDFYRDVAFCVLWLGVRVSDLNHQRVENFNIDEDNIRFDVLFSKNRRQQKHAVTILIPRADLPPLPSSLLERLGKTSGPVFEMPVTATGLNSFLLKVVQQTKCSGTPPTSYSLRRNFIHRVIAEMTDEVGEVAWNRVMLRTGHMSANVLKSAYAKKAKDLRATKRSYSGRNKRRMVRR